MKVNFLICDRCGKFCSLKTSIVLDYWVDDGCEHERVCKRCQKKQKDSKAK